MSEQRLRDAARAILSVADDLAVRAQREAANHIDTGDDGCEWLVDLRWPEERASYCIKHARRAERKIDELLDIEILGTSRRMRALCWYERAHRLYALAAVQAIEWLLDSEAT